MENKSPNNMENEAVRQNTDAERLLDIQDLRIWYRSYRGNAQVVDGIDMHVNSSEKIGLVGESGCGKTTVMKNILRLYGSDKVIIPSGQILYKGNDILKMNNSALNTIRREEISMISQEPMAALNPVYTVGFQMSDIIRYSGYGKGMKKKDLREICRKAIVDVMIPDPDRILDSYPYQLSGGMRQRICIAMSLVTPRRLLIADEPGTALDVTVQSQIHGLLRSLVDEKGRSLIMITHSLGVARELVDRIYIMYAGNIVECAETKDIFANALHPYTKGLIECVPRLFGGGISAGIYGYVPDYVNPEPGCRFCSRCRYATKKCKMEKPPLLELANGHQVACWQYASEGTQGNGGNSDNERNE